MHQVIYNDKLEHKCILTPLGPRLLYIGPIKAKSHLSFRDTCPDSYSNLFVLCKVVTLQWAFGSNLHDLKNCVKNHMKSYEKSYMKSYMHCSNCGLVVI